jgi:dolichol-phosphate mannosyltransferase
MSSMNEFSLSIIIPAHNEANLIAKTIEDIIAAVAPRSIDCEIIVVNDVSEDNTEAVIRELMNSQPLVRLVNRQSPPGFGRAVRAGVEAAVNDVVVIVMADQSDDPEDIIRYYDTIAEGYDCAFGSRFVEGSTVVGYPKVKLIANRIVNRCIQVLFWTHFNDLSNAFKAYRREVLEHCGPFHASHFNITIEMSLSALIRGYKIKQIPIKWYGRTWGSSKLRITEMGRRYLCVLLKCFFERMLISDDLKADRAAHDERQNGEEEEERKKS